MNWIPFDDPDQLEEILTQSQDPEILGVLIFKHSTRCSISSMALSRLERSWEASEEKTPSYLLDLLRFPELSRLVSQKFEVHHESPQVLLIRENKCVYYASHNSINSADLEEMLLASSGM